MKVTNVLGSSLFELRLFLKVLAPGREREEASAFSGTMIAVGGCKYR